MSIVSAPRRGFTLAEVLVALILAFVTLGALHGSAAFALRRLRTSAHESIAIQLVQRRGEQLLASPCAVASGVDTSGVVVDTWTATTDGKMVHLAQTVRYPTPWGERSEVYHAAGACR